MTKPCAFYYVHALPALPNKHHSDFYYAYAKNILYMFRAQVPILINLYGTYGRELLIFLALQLLPDSDLTYSTVPEARIT